MALHYRETSTVLTAPSLSLPPLGRLVQQPTDLVAQALYNLHCLYFPATSSGVLDSSLFAIPKRNIKHSIHDSSVPDSGYASAEEDEDDIVSVEVAGSDEGIEVNEAIEILRADPFERAFAIKWLTGFVTQSYDWIDVASSDIDSDARSELLDGATALLSAFTGSGDEEDTTLTRTFTFPVSDGGIVNVELNDEPLSKDDHTSVGLQSWGSSILLAERFCADPAFFSLIPRTNHPLRILELGAGTGMLAIVASKLLQLHSGANTPKPEIIATDYHPDVLKNLSKNISANACSSHLSISVVPLDWESPNYASTPLNKPFDIILAADVIYHPCHAQWIKACVENLLSRDGSHGGVFWLIIPIRSTGRHEGMHTTVDILFPDATEGVEDVIGKEARHGRKQEPHLAVLYREEVGRQGNVGRADEGGYKLYKIGWDN